MGIFDDAAADLERERAVEAAMQERAAAREAESIGVMNELAAEFAAFAAKHQLPTERLTGVRYGDRGWVVPLNAPSAEHLSGVHAVVVPSGAWFYGEVTRLTSAVLGRDLGIAWTERRYPQKAFDVSSIRHSFTHAAKAYLTRG